MAPKTPNLPKQAGTRPGSTLEAFTSRRTKLWKNSGGPIHLRNRHEHTCKLYASSAAFTASAIPFCSYSSLRRLENTWPELNKKEKKYLWVNLLVFGLIGAVCRQSSALWIPWSLQKNWALARSTFCARAEALLGSRTMNWPPGN